jgi:hypothetical protein
MPKQIKKFTRSRKLVPNIRLQPRDIEILKDLADYRFLDSKQIIALHPAGESPRYIQYRLQNLFHHGFVDRPPAQVSFYRNRSHLIYSLGPQGAALLGQDNPDSRFDFGSQKKSADKTCFLAAGERAERPRLCFRPEAKRRSGRIFYHRRQKRAVEFLY